MDCKIELIERYYDKELSEAERAEVQTHLAGCSECATELARLNATGGFLRAGAPELPKLEALSPMFARIRAGRLARMQDPRVIRLAKWLTSAAAAIMLTCGAALWTMSGQAAKGNSSNPSWTAYAVSANDEQVLLLQAADPLAPAVADVRDFGRD